MDRPHNDNRRICGRCAGWDGGDDAAGECVWRRRAVGRQELACPDYFPMPSAAELRTLR